MKLLTASLAILLLTSCRSADYADLVSVENSVQANDVFVNGVKISSHVEGVGVGKFDHDYSNIHELAIRITDGDKIFNQTKALYIIIDLRNLIFGHQGLNQNVSIFLMDGGLEDGKLIGFGNHRNIACDPGVDARGELVVKEMIQDEKYLRFNAELDILITELPPHPIGSCPNDITPSRRLPAYVSANDILIDIDSEVIYRSFDKGGNVTFEF